MSDWHLSNLEHTRASPTTHIQLFRLKFQSILKKHVSIKDQNMKLLVGQCHMWLQGLADDGLWRLQDPTILHSASSLWSHGAMRQIKNSKVGTSVQCPKRMVCMLVGRFFFPGERTFLDAAAEPVCNFIADIHMGDAKPLHL
eukprot:1250774-Amphidinium_carterae.1